MAIGNPVSYWYGTKAQYNAIQTKLEDTLYFITDEQTLYKGTVRFAEGVEQLSDVGSSAPANPSAYDKYFNTSDGKIYVYNGTTWGNAYYPAEGNMYYDKNAKRFVYFVPTYDGTTVTGGSMADVYDAGVSGDSTQGVSIQGTSTVTVANASVNGKGVVKIGDNINVNNAGVISVSVANASTFGLVKTGDNITNTNGIISVAKATTSSLGVVKVGSNINVDNNGQISVPVADDDTKGVVSAGENVNNNNGVFSVNTGSTDVKGVVKVGTNIDVDDGVISVKDASTSDKGVVQLVNDAGSDMSSEVKAITPHAVSQVAESLSQEINTKQDNLSAVEPVVLNSSTVSLNYDAPLYKNGSNLALNIGDGLDVGVAGSTNANKLIVNEASVKEVLEDVVDGGTEPAVNEIVTADNLRGALSVGQAVDVSCAPEYNEFDNISLDGGTTWQPITKDLLNEAFLGEFIIEETTANTAVFGFRYSGVFPKYANGLKYLTLFDFKITGRDRLAIIKQKSTSSTETESAWFTGDSSNWTRAWAVVNSNVFWLSDNNYTKPLRIAIKNWRQYEVTALTDEAIAYLAQLPDPDAFFRSTSAYSIRDKYLIKQDMVCPFIPTINMPDNSDLTVAAGLSYKIKYTNDNPHTITADTIPTDAYGQDAHIKMFIKGTSAIHFTEPLVLMDALTPNAGHNLSVKFRDGQAFVYVDDTDAGYVVTVASGNTNGTLNYAITGGTTDYAIFSADLDGTTIDAGSVTFVGTSENTTMNILGNGIEDTVITGNISVNANRTMNLQSLTINGGTIGTGSTTGYMILEDVALSGNIELCENQVVNFDNVELLEGSTIHTLFPLHGSSNIKIHGSGIFDGTGTSLRAITTNTPISIDGITFSNFKSGYSGAVGLVRRPFIVNNCTVTGCTAVGNYCGGFYADSTSATPTYITGCTFYNNAGSGGRDIIAGSGSTVTVRNTDAESIQARGGGTLVVYDSLITSNFNIYIEGHIVIGGSISTRHLFQSSVTDYSKASITVLDGTTITFIGTTGYTDELCANLNTIGDNVKFIWGDNTESTIDACASDSIESLSIYKVNHGVKYHSIVVTSDLPVWNMSNFKLISVNIKASKADTIKLSGITFNGTSLVENASRIQLPNGSTNSFQGNTNDADTKILDAGLIVVGDNPASPSGSATVVNASGTSSTVSGIGTYIDKEGDNDFVAVAKVVGATTSEEFATALTAETQADGTNRFIKLATGSTVTADSGNLAVIDVVNKSIITHDYEPILTGGFKVYGGTAGVRSGEVTFDEPNKTITFNNYSGISFNNGSLYGTLKTDNWLYVSKNAGVYGRGTVDFMASGKGIRPGVQYDNQTLNIEGLTFQNRKDASSGMVYFATGVASNTVDCTFKNNTATNIFQVLSTNGDGYASFTRCRFENNTCGMATIRVIAYYADITDCYFGTAEKVRVENTGANRGAHVVLHGTNKTLSYISNIGSTPTTIVLSPDSVLDLTDNTIAQPISSVSNSGSKVVVGTVNHEQVVCDETTTPNTITIRGITYGFYQAYTDTSVTPNVNVPAKIVINGQTVNAKYAVLSDGNVIENAWTKTVQVVEFIDGGTASVILKDGSRHHVSGRGTYIQNAITGGTFSDLTEID